MTVELQSAAVLGDDPDDPVPLDAAEKLHWADPAQARVAVETPVVVVDGRRQRTPLGLDSIPPALAPIAPRCAAI